MKLLLENGADPNARQSGGWSALHSAAQMGSLEMAQLLLAHGADVQARADNNQISARYGNGAWPRTGDDAAGRVGCAAAIIAAACLGPMLDSQLEELRRSTLAAFASASGIAELEESRVQALGRKGTLAAISKEFGKLTPEDRARLGKLLNSVKQDLESEYESKKQRFDRSALAERLAREWIDVTLPAPGVRPGSLHPITQIQEEIEDLFTSLGFAVLDGPEVETEENNFDALNIPPTHPARDMQDTFWLSNGALLRTHTSPVQVRGMRKLGPPLRMIAPGRTFRNEEVDASHDHTFYQLEGMMVDRDVSVANLIYFMRTLLSSVFRRDAHSPASSRILSVCRAGLRTRHSMPDLQWRGLPGV